MGLLCAIVSRRWTKVPIHAAGCGRFRDETRVFARHGRVLHKTAGCATTHARAAKPTTDRGAITFAIVEAAHRDVSQLSARAGRWMVARASHRSKLAVCAPRSSASRSTLEWKRWSRTRYTWLGLVQRARCEPRRGNARQVATDAHRGRASPAKTVFIFVAHLPQYNNCAQPDQNSGDENYHNFFWSSLSPHQPYKINFLTMSKF